jgi:hypothetical protein
MCKGLFNEMSPYMYGSNFFLKTLKQSMKQWKHITLQITIYMFLGTILYSIDYFETFRNYKKLKEIYCVKLCAS